MNIFELHVAGLQYLGSICFLGAGFDPRTPTSCAEGTPVTNDFVSSGDTSIPPSRPVQSGFPVHLVTKGHMLVVHIFKIITCME